MKKLSTISTLFIIALFIFEAGCKSGKPASNNSPNKPSAASATASSNANQPAAAPTASTPPGASGATAGATGAIPAGKAELVGTYESREVHDKGVITVLSQLRTLWMFSSDGTYSRVSEVKGKPYHADSGTFRIEPPDKLILSIQVTGLKTQREMQNPPISKTHKFELSADGEELRLTSDKGTTGIFRRVSKPERN